MCRCIAWWANGIAGTDSFGAGLPGRLRWASTGWRGAGCEPAAAALALAFFALNPNLLYLQTTAMTEPLFLCEMIWTVVWLVEWRGALEHETRSEAAGCSG